MIDTIPTAHAGGHLDSFAMGAIPVSATVPIPPGADEAGIATARDAAVVALATAARLVQGMPCHWIEPQHADGAARPVSGLNIEEFV
ncbi:hypothetical protein [Rhodobacter lacus]|uniref:Uncharacterized protein n=1 Tax=Rhodobacter lacus TaxID=1641972 RepID=A0ABW5AD40_9RHOB